MSKNTTKTLPTYQRGHVGRYYSDPEREDETGSLPNVEVWLAGCVQCAKCTDLRPDDQDACDTCGETAAEEYDPDTPLWFWYAFGFPGCLRDSGPFGPYDCLDDALFEARS